MTLALRKNAQRGLIDRPIWLPRRGEAPPPALPWSPSRRRRRPPQRPAARRGARHHAAAPQTTPMRAAPKTPISTNAIDKLAPMRESRGPPVSHSRGGKMDPPAFPTDQVRGLKAHGIAEKGGGEKTCPSAPASSFSKRCATTGRSLSTASGSRDVAADPRFAGAAQSLAELYDMQHDPALHRPHDLRLAVERRAGRAVLYRAALGRRPDPPPRDDQDSGWTRPAACSAAAPISST